jgi:16S rRNA (uracil1498-N3)-methyltransferase
LSDDECHHARVRRLGIGTAVRVVDGAGTEALGTLVRLAKRAGTVEIHQVQMQKPPDPLHLLLPIADRERMLWLAEKAAELAVTSWRPVLWHRSRSVSPRGEGMLFQGKIRARMIAAAKQSGSAWLPELHPDAAPSAAIAAAPSGDRLLLTARGSPMVGKAGGAPLTIVLGPEGGLAPEEEAALEAAGFIPVSLGATTLRFETAGVVALGIARASGPNLTEDHGG